MAAGDRVNPAQFSDTIIDWLRDNLGHIVDEDVLVFDPFAGEGTKLGRLCDELGLDFAGNDLERWKDRERRVRTADSTIARNYPKRRYVVVTSPTYNNGVNDHFKPADTSRRLTYRNSLGHELHPHNTGRYSGRGSKTAEAEYWRLHRACVIHWPDLVIVNVKDSQRNGKIYPLGAKWMALLRKHDYTITSHKVPVTGWRFGENHEARSDFEWVLVGKKESQ